MDKYMKIANDNAKKAINKGEGGPFGAVIVDKYGNIIAEGNNRVISKKDPTAHAEMEAIRNACEKLDTYDLSDYILYTSCEPCPMCLSAIIWANIKKVYYGCSKEDADNIGFKDNIIYDFIKGNENEILKLEQIDRIECIKTFQKYKENDGIIY